MRFTKDLAPAALLDQEVKDGKAKEAVNLGDTNSLKRVLDDKVAEVFTSCGYKDDNIYTDLKIVLGLAACLVALLAQFYPVKYPKNIPLLVACVGVYCILSMALSYIAAYQERDAILFTVPKKHMAGLRVASKLPRFSDAYTLSICARNVAKPQSSDMVMQERSIARYFDCDGLLVEEAFAADVKQLLHRFEQRFSKNK